ncbi:MAG: glycosyltransferase family 9 protein [Chitinivibrionales bacterium]|nr:glycosyltransferase family 9 protein [Chitinivibrionales bacterium]
MPHHSAKKYLVILPNNFGDVIMATPVLLGIKKENPESYIAYLVEDGFEGGLLNNPDCDTIIRFPRNAVKTEINSQNWRAGLGRLKEIVAEINGHEFTDVINLAQHTYISYLVSCLQCGRIAGQHFLAEGNQAITDDWTQYLYAVPFARRFNRMHATDIYRRIAGVRRHSGGYTLKLTESESDEARLALQSGGIEPGKTKIAFFQVGAALPSKQWPGTHFIALGQMLVAEGWSIVLSGAPYEAELAQGIAEAIGQNCFVAAGKMSLRESIALLDTVAACVTADTALMHAAAALKVPTFALFGPTSPQETGPYGNNNRVFCGRCPRRPCFCITCATQLCMKSILPQTVFNAIRGSTDGLKNDCDMFTTKLLPDGDYELLASAASAAAYYDEVGSALTKALFEGGETPGIADIESLKIHRDESAQFVNRCKAMENHLKEYLIAGLRDPVGRFEEEKKRLTGLSGIGAFWSALLNIRLNSIPVMDFAKAIEQSISSLEKTGAAVSLVAGSKSQS